MRFGPDDADDFDLASIPSSDLPVIKMHMLHAVVAFNRIANARTLLAAGADAGHYCGKVRRRSLPLQASITSR